MPVHHRGTRHRPRAAIGPSLAVVGLLGLAVPALAQTASAPIAIAPLTRVTASPRSGYFSDPYPIHLASPLRPFAPQFFSGTTQEVLACPDRIVEADCLALSAVKLDPSSLAAQATAVGSRFTISKTHNIYQDGTGALQMAATFEVTNPAFPKVAHWNVIVHAHPVDPLDPTRWAADAVLVGSLGKPAKADYDGKYFEDSGSLYLVYSRRLSNDPAHDGLVAQAMRSFTQPASTAPITLLEPDDANGGLNSEYFFGLDPKNPFKLVETGNITKIDGKYALAYSTGAFDRPGYKTGIAWSDSFLPAPGTVYRKVLKPDTADVWGQPDHDEVVYLLQSQEPDWPNYVAGQVIAPGVPSIVRDPGTGAYHLFFAGYAPDDAPTDPATGAIVASDRRPFTVPVTVAIPADATVASATDQELAGWITPVTR